MENHCSRGLSFQTGCRKENGVFSCVDTDSFCFSNLVTGERRAEVFLLKDRQGQRKGGRHGRPFKRWNQTPGSCSLVETLPTQGMACASLGDRCPGPLLLPGGSRKEPSLAWGLPAAFSAAALVVRCSEGHRVEEQVTEVPRGCDPCLGKRIHVHTHGTVAAPTPRC